jgi:LysR family transcriptional activator of dmlA
MNGPEGVESVKVTGSIGSNHSDIVLNWGLEGRGVMLLAVWDIAERLKDGSLVRVLPTYHQPADVWAVTAQRPSASAKLRQCLDFLVGELRHGRYALDTSLA